MPIESVRGQAPARVAGRGGRRKIGPGSFRSAIYSTGVGGASFAVPVKDPPTGHAAQFLVGDSLRIKALTATGVIENWWRVDASIDPGVGTGYWIYNCTRVYGTPGTFPAGAAVVDYGQANQGWISLSSDGTIGSSPNISMGTHAGQPWLTTTLTSRWGNLNGSYGKVTDVMGIGIGDYSSGNYLRYDTAAGFLLSAGAGAVSIDANGVAIVVSTAVALNRSYKFSGVDATTAWGLYGIESGGVQSLGLALSANTGSTSTLLTSVEAVALATYQAEAYLRAASGGTSVYVDLIADSNASSYAAISGGTGLTVGALAAPNAMLDVRGSAIATGGLNVGSATGAGTGEIRASSSLFLGGSSTGNFQTLILSILNNGVAQILPANNTGMAFILGISTGKVAIFATQGGVNATQEISDPSANYSITAGTAGTNVYWSAGNNRYEIENKEGATRSYIVFLFAPA